MRSVHNFLSKFPDLPRVNYKTLAKGTRRSNVTIASAGNEICNLWKEDAILATDMWLVLCFGLRFHDLLKVKFESKDG